MSIQTDTFVGTGKTRFISLPFDPEWVVIRGNATGVNIAQKADGTWVDRMAYMSAFASVNSGIHINKGELGFWVGSNNDVNKNGTTFHYIALARSSSLAMTFANWHGNGLAGNVIDLLDQITPIAAFIKRDNALPGVWKTNASSASLSANNGTTVANAVTAFGAGAVTVGTASHTNELDGPNGVGEAVKGIFFGACSVVSVDSWTGDGTTNRTITLPFTPKAVFIQAPAAAMRMLTDTISPSVLTANSVVAALANEVRIVTNGIELISTAMNVNAAVVQYVAIGDHSDTVTPYVAPSISGRRSVFLAGRDVPSGIRCGTSDTLSLAGAHSIEWFGAVEFEDRLRNKSSSMIVRGGGAKAVGDVAASFNWGLLLMAPDDFAQNWRGPQVGAICADRYVTGGDIRKTWRTGILQNHNAATHWLVTHNGTGRWKLYRNGALIKTKNLDMTGTNLALPNCAAISGAPTVIGATDSSGSLIGSQRMNFVAARLYGRELTKAEALARYLREALRMTAVTDVSDFVEEWRADNASGNTLPATVNAANNGTIFGGSVLTLA